MSENSNEQDGIVQLTDVRAKQSEETVDQIYDYWAKERRGRLVPSRADIDPRGLEGVLAHAFVLERIAAGLARFRIAGAHMNDVMGSDVRGMPLSAVFMPESRDLLSEVLTDAFDAPAVVRLNVMSEGGFGRKEVRGRMLLLPLRSDLGDITRILGAVSVDGPLGRAPRRLVIEHETRISLTGFADVPEKTSKRPTRPVGHRRVLTTPAPTMEQRGLRLVVDNT